MKDKLDEAGAGLDVPPENCPCAACQTRFAACSAARWPSWRARRDGWRHLALNSPLRSILLAYLASCLLAAGAANDLVHPADQLVAIIGVFGKEKSTDSFRLRIVSLAPGATYRIDVEFVSKETRVKSQESMLVTPTNPSIEQRYPHPVEVV